MTDTKSFKRGSVVMVVAVVGGQAVHWFLTPMDHPEASMFRTVAVGVQAAVGFAGAIWAARRMSPQAP